MSSLLVIIMFTSGIAMSIAILLMAPKGGLGFGLGGYAGNNEYGTKKSIETSLKQVAMRAGIVFVVTCLIYPFSKPKIYNPEDALGTGANTAPSFDLGTGASNDINITNTGS